MYTFLVNNLDDNINISELSLFLEKNYHNYEVIVACKNKKNINKLNKIKLYEFESNNFDSALNTLFSECEGTHIVVVRKLYNVNNLKKLTNACKKDNDIVMFSKKKNLFVRLFNKVMSIIVKFMYGYELFNCNVNEVCFSKIPSNVLKNLEYPSIYTKINKWVGINFVEVEGDSFVYKNKLGFLKNLIIGTVCIFLAVSTILVWVFASFLFNALTIKILGFGVILAALTIGAIQLVMSYVKYQVGVPNVNKTIINKQIAQETHNIKGENDGKN